MEDKGKRDRTESPRNSTCKGLGKENEASGGARGQVRKKVN